MLTISNIPLDDITQYDILCIYAQFYKSMPSTIVSFAGLNNDIFMRLNNTIFISYRAVYESIHNMPVDKGTQI